MPLVVIEVERAPRRLLGMLHRSMLELRAGMFAGNLPKRMIDDIWQYVTESTGNCNAVLVESVANEHGVLIRTHGANRRQITDNFGLPLMTYRCDEKNT